jgi:hypothetical protein
MIDDDTNTNNTTREILEGDFITKTINSRQLLADKIKVITK